MCEGPSICCYLGVHCNTRTVLNMYAGVTFLQMHVVLVVRHRIAGTMKQEATEVPTTSHCRSMGAESVDDWKPLGQRRPGDNVHTQYDNKNTDTSNTRSSRDRVSTNIEARTGDPNIHTSSDSRVSIPQDTPSAAYHQPQRRRFGSAPTKIDTLVRITSES